MSRADQVDEQPHCSGNSGGKLAEESIAGININSFPVLCHEQPALLRRFIRIMAGEQRFEMIVPLRHEVESALLYPSIKIFAGDLVGK